MKEEERVAAVVSTIDNEARIVPRGAFIKTPLAAVHTNRSFEGKKYLKSHISSKVHNTGAIIYESISTQNTHYF